MYLPGNQLTPHSLKWVQKFRCYGGTYIYSQNHYNVFNKINKYNIIFSLIIIIISQWTSDNKK